MRNTSRSMNDCIKVPHLVPRLFQIKLHHFKRYINTVEMHCSDNIKVIRMQVLRCTSPREAPCPRYNELSSLQVSRTFFP